MTKRLAPPGPRHRAGRLVRRNLAAGAVPLPGRRRLVARSHIMTAAVRGMDGHGANATPDGPKLHSVIVDPRDGRAFLHRM